MSGLLLVFATLIGISFVGVMCAAVIAGGIMNLKLLDQLTEDLLYGTYICFWVLAGTVALLFLIASLLLQPVCEYFRLFLRKKRKYWAESLGAILALVVLYYIIQRLSEIGVSLL
jgi:phosphatidylglycerophosphate synthase